MILLESNPRAAVVQPKFCFSPHLNCVFWHSESVLHRHILGTSDVSCTVICLSFEMESTLDLSFPALLSY